MVDNSYEDGMTIRRQVLGNDYVDQDTDKVTDFSRPYVELVVEYCWGRVWPRPGLDRKTRSIINVAMLTALNRPHETRIHIRGALNNGVTEEELREVLLQTAVYCGVPAAGVSFRIAEEVLAEIEGET